jgi:hypothetical protein
MRKLSRAQLHRWTMVMDGYPPWTDPKLRRCTQQIAGSIDIGLHYKPNRTEVGVSGFRKWKPLTGDRQGGGNAPGVSRVGRVERFCFTHRLSPLLIGCRSARRMHAFSLISFGGVVHARASRDEWRVASGECRDCHGHEAAWREEIVHSITC